MMISETKHTNPKMVEGSNFGYEHIHTYCSEEQCRNEATHAYVCRFQFVMWICESCIIDYQEEVVVRYQ